MKNRFGTFATVSVVASALFALAPTGCGNSGGADSDGADAGGADSGSDSGGNSTDLGWGLGGGLDVGSGGSGDSGTGGAGVVPPEETCGGEPCADHSGDQEFVEVDAPEAAAELFGAGTVNDSGTDETQEPSIVYPSHETMFPINVSHIHHEWTAGGTNDLFQLTFVGPETTVTVYTVKSDWEPTDEEWDWLAESNRGQAVELTVSALDTAAPEQIWQSEPITLYFSAAEVEGGIYYWSTGSAGVMKALVSDRIPEKFYTDPAATDANTCVACHTLSRDGKRLAVGYGGEKLKEVSVPGREAIVPATGAPTRAMGWTTFSPDGELLLVANKGVLTLTDSDTGETVGPDAGIVPLAGKLATHPDWSALGSKVVVSLTTKADNKNMEGGSIALISYDDGAWGEPEVIVESSGGTDNNFFPVFSPDSKWIAYVHAEDASKDEPTAVLRLVPTAGGAPIDLVRLNHRVSNVDEVMDVGDSMPTWAPSTKAGVFWLAFSSLRAYGTLRAADDKLDQIWIAAVDTTKADPGYSAFWAPFQSMPEGNHRAFWTHVEGEMQCRCSEICDDGIDNNCNGTADEDSCAVCLPTEICDNGEDDNCDCVIDNCGSVDPDPVVK